MRGKEKKGKQIQFVTWPGWYSLQKSTVLLLVLQGMSPDKMLEPLCHETVVMGKQKE